MNLHWPGGLGRRLSAALLVAGAMVGTGSSVATASTCVSWSGTPPANPSASGDSLAGVTVLSPCDAWVVGYKQVGTPTQTLTEHWNGIGWAVTPSANPGGSSNDNAFDGVAATSPGKAWAVGHYSNGTANQTLIELFIGGVWEQVSSPNPGGAAHDNFLNAVAASSAKNAWAVGSYTKGTTLLTLIEHWNGAAWAQVPSPNPSSTSNELLGVVATSSTNAWAVGSYADRGNFLQTLIEHWNGTKWKRVPSPSPAGPSEGNSLDAVAASGSSTWAVGTDFKGGVPQALAEHWTGTVWKRVPTPSLGASVPGALAGVTVLSARDAWAVGNYLNLGNHTLTEHWNGSAWKRVPSPNPGTFNVLTAVASSRSSVWAAGFYNAGGPDLAMAFHCC